MYKYLNRLAILAVTFYALSFSSAMAQLPTPSLLCLSVQDDGSILANWEVEGISSNIFRVFYKPSDSLALTFVSVDFQPNIFSDIIPVTDAKTRQYDVYMVTYDGDNEYSAQSLTLKTILPMVNSLSGSNDGIAIVEWISGNNIIAGNSIVYRSIDNINFNKVGETSTNSFRDTIEGICNPTVLYYRIEFHNENCTFNSMTGFSSSSLLDNTAPKDPKFTFITINEAGFAILNWIPSNATDLAGYQIEVNDGSGWKEHATIDITNTFTDDLTDPLLHPHYLDPCTQIVKYVLKAVDKCGNSSKVNVYDASSIHNTIWLDVDLEVNCNRKATLKWNKYNNMTPPVSSYQIWRSRNDSLPRVIRTIDANGSAEYSYTDDFLIPDELYTYHISAINGVNDMSSESCRVEVVADPELLNAFELENVTVYDNEYIQLYGNGNPIDFINKVAIYRSETTPDNFELLTTIPWNSTDVEIPETSAKVNETAYYYQLAALDACGYEIERSTVMRSIFLQLEDQGNNGVRLNWNAFEGWDENLLGYDIYRMTNDILDQGFPKIAMPGTLVFSDNIDPAATNGRITYYVEATRRHDDIRSRSNEVLLLGEAKVIMPNAFKPTSNIEKNKIFIPVARNVDNANYRFTIYNRWGQMVFETNDPAEGWDGTRNGSLSPSGIYGYLVVYSDYNGISHSQRGAVNLLK